MRRVNRNSSMKNENIWLEGSPCEDREENVNEKHFEKYEEDCEEAV
jgi:hypothetical protein